ncbi:hypothetical protein [Neoactinobaculum massilliense]|uniref:hypothetical protein n=1 Tax=Neoactinobaculum massilliense TaxID=2364794 RepID=UPI000F51E05B|nr:hypothetical protein [Neoactinobaculum massilliense]
MRWVFIGLFAAAMSVGTVVSWGPRREETDEGEVQRPTKTLLKFGCILTVCGVFVTVLSAAFFVIALVEWGHRDAQIGFACFAVGGVFSACLGWAYLNYYRVKWVRDGVGVFEDVDWRGRRRVIRHEDITEWGWASGNMLLAVWGKDGQVVNVNLKLFRAPNLIAATKQRGTRKKVPFRLNQGF